MNQQADRTEMTELLELFYSARPLQGLHNGYPVIGLSDVTISRVRRRLEQLTRQGNGKDSSGSLSLLAQRLNSMLSEQVIQRTHPLFFVNALQDGLAGCITHYSQGNAAELTLFTDRLHQLTEKALRSHQTGCRPEYELAIEETNHLVQWLQAGGGDTDQALQERLQAAAAALAEYRDHLTHRIPQLDTDCQIGAGRLAELFRARYGRELELEAELAAADEFHDGILKRLRRESATFHQRFQTDPGADPVAFTLRELGTDSPRPEEIPARVQNLVRRLLRFQAAAGISREVEPPQRYSYLEFSARHFPPARLLGPGTAVDTVLVLSPAARELSGQLDPQYSYVQLEIDSMRVAAQQTIMSGFPLPLPVDWLPVENLRGAELLWLQTLQSAGWGKGDIRIRIGADLLLLREVKSYIALLRYHGLGEDDQAILEGLVEGNCYLREDALREVDSLKIAPFTVGSGFPVYRELKRLLRYHRRKLSDRLTIAELHHLLLASALMPSAAMGRYVSDQLRRLKAPDMKDVADGTDQHV